MRGTGQIVAIIEGRLDAIANPPNSKPRLPEQLLTLHHALYCLLQMLNEEKSDD